MGTTIYLSEERTLFRAFLVPGLSRNSKMKRPCKNDRESLSQTTQKNRYNGGKVAWRANHEDDIEATRTPSVGPPRQKWTQIPFNSLRQIESQENRYEKPEEQGGYVALNIVVFYGSDRWEFWRDSGPRFV